MKPLNIVEAAEVEFREAIRWYRDRDPRVANRFVAEARRTLQLLQSFPQIGSRIPTLDDDVDVRRLPIHTFPYHVVFVEFSDRLEVVAFAHDRRRPSYFMSRLRRS